MKFVITNTDGWRWNLTAPNGKVIASGEAYQKPQKMIQSLHRYIIREDPELTAALEKGLHKLGLDETGRQL